MDFLIHHNGREIGPYTESEVRSRLIFGAITLTDLCWHEGATDWKPLSSFEQFTTTYPPKPPPLPPRLVSLTPPSPSPSLAPNTLGSYTRITL